MTEIKEQNIKVNVCHKCGLVRSTEPKLALEQFDLHRCRCIGQNWFDYESKQRTVKEAKEIAHKQYLAFARLYRSQGRGSVDFQRLDEEYGENRTQMKDL